MWQRSIAIADIGKFNRGTRSGARPVCRYRKWVRSHPLARNRGIFGMAERNNRPTPRGSKRYRHPGCTAPLVARAKLSRRSSDHQPQAPRTPCVSRARSRIDRQRNEALRQREAAFQNARISQVRSLTSTALRIIPVNLPDEDRPDWAKLFGVGVRGPELMEFAPSRSGHRSLTGCRRYVLAGTKTGESSV